MDYKLTPSNALVKSIINNPLQPSYINSNIDKLIKSYKNYEKSYRIKCIQINNNYLQKIENIKKHIYKLDQSIIKEKTFFNNNKKSIEIINNNEIYRNDEISINNQPSCASFIFLTENRETNKFINKFIKSLYKIKKTELTNKDISINSLWYNDDINKTILSYKNYFLIKLEKETNKNKVFVNQIKSYQIKLYKLNAFIEQLINEIIIFRKGKLDFYNNTNNTNNLVSNYNDVYNRLLSNGEIKLDKLDEFYFFDNESIFKKIIEIKNHKTEITNIEKEITLISSKKQIYNSRRYNNLLDSICNHNEVETVCLYEQINTDINNKNGIKMYPIIIDNKTIFNNFYNKINKILITKLSNEMKVTQENIKSFKDEINKLKIEKKMCEDELNNIKVNKKLVMNYLFYKKKLLLLEKDILKQSKQCDFLN